MDDKIITLKLSLQRALLGEVTENLIAVTAGIIDLKIFIRAYFDEKATDSETERIALVGTEVIADFPDSYTLEEQIRTVSRQDELEMLDFWAYFRSKV